MEKTQTAENLSQWFNLAEQKPWEPGVYEVQRKDYDYSGQFSLFKNGKFHEVGANGPNSANIWAKSFGVGDGCDVVKWRGLASDPNAKPKPKALGNRRVTRYVVRSLDCKHLFASFKSVDVARNYAENINEPVRITKIRFRSPEAD